MCHTMPATCVKGAAHVTPVEQRMPDAPLLDLTILTFYTPLIGEGLQACLDNVFESTYELTVTEDHAPPGRPEEVVGKLARDIVYLHIKADELFRVVAEHEAGVVPYLMQPLPRCLCWRKPSWVTYIANNTPLLKNAFWGCLHRQQSVCTLHLRKAPCKPPSKPTAYTEC